ncbi:ORF6N domain-containing protein [Izhakiella capsodis]|uniref:ORF6N domain-containing protein n=1 Tax=Izhakiella capsodis TaxID=1367852 RepID=A0A1I5BTJ4_9GAMM|nr:ORF6N domain-containing protein [Izhakiella capsodis]SFN77983.1 ORF6N domain-containing protein [Izhakiella capsodis]
MYTITAETLTPIKHNQIPVVTTELLAQLYCSEEKYIRQNYKRNEDRFVSGKHYYKVTGSELHDLRTSQRGLQISPKTRSLILWTERGAARHAKMLETDQAWEVFEKLEDSYFRQPASQRQPFNADLHITIRNDEIISIRSLSAGEYVMSLSVFEEMIGRKGYKVVHKDDIKEAARKYLLERL